MKNIFQLTNTDNAAAKVFFTMLAIWRNCPRDTEPSVIRFFEQAGKHLLKYRDSDFVELLSRMLDFPRKGKFDPGNPNFADLVNESIAESCGSRRRLRPEAFYCFNFPLQPQRRQVQKFSKNQENKPVNRLKASSLLQANNLLGPENTALDGIKSHYVNGPFQNPTCKLDLSHCCFCWNLGKQCKFLNPEGVCRKLHICSHEICRTLYRHGHRIIDHDQKGA